jgi:hypothetical protein
MLAAVEARVAAGVPVEIREAAAAVPAVMPVRVAVERAERTMAAAVTVRVPAERAGVNLKVNISLLSGPSFSPYLSTTSMRILRLIISFFCLQPGKYCNKKYSASLSIGEAR